MHALVSVDHRKTCMSPNIEEYLPFSSFFFIRREERMQSGKDQSLSWIPADAATSLQMQDSHVALKVARVLHPTPLALAWC